MPEDFLNPADPPARSPHAETGRRIRFGDTTVEDAALLERVLHGDQAAMAAIFDRYSSMVYSVALRVLHDPGEAEDVMQEIFIQVWKNPSAFISGKGSLGAWLLVVTRNRAIDGIRRRKPSDSVDDVVLVSSTNLASEAERNTLMAKVRQVITSLPPEQRRSLEMAYFDGMTHTEIAAKTGDPLGTVKTRIRLALSSLRKAMAA